MDGRPWLLAVLVLEQKGEEDGHATVDDDDDAGSCSVRFSADPSFRFVGIDVAVVAELGSANEEDDDEEAEEAAVKVWSSP